MPTHAQPQPQTQTHPQPPTQAQAQAPAGYMMPGFPAPIDLNLALNECAPTAGDLADIVASLPADAAARYPRLTALERDIARHARVDPARVIVTTGGDDAIDRLIRYTVLKRSPSRRAVVMHRPTFPIIPIAAQNAGAEVIAPLWLDGDFPEAQLAAAVDEGCALLALVTPNNPTGREIPAAAVARLCEHAARAGVPAMVDLAYVEFAGHDPTHDLLGFDNVVMIRTLSKAWGMAGLRVGYAIAAPAMIDNLRAMGGPFPTSSLSAAIASAVLARGDGPMRRNVAGVTEARARVAQALAALGATVPASAANFLLPAFPGPDHAHRFLLELAHRGIGVRRYPDNPLLADRVRITCPPGRADADRLVDAIHDIAAGHRLAP